MDLLYSFVWAENKVPGTTWFKEKIKYLFEQREKYEHGRQELEQSGNSDHPEASG